MAMSPLNSTSWVSHWSDPAQVASPNSHGKASGLSASSNSPCIMSSVSLISKGQRLPYPVPAAHELRDFEKHQRKIQVLVQSEALFETDSKFWSPN